MLALILSAALAGPGAEPVQDWFYVPSREAEGDGASLVLMLSDLGEVSLDCDADTLLIEYIPDRVFGGHTQLAVDRTGKNASLLRFPVESGLQIERATLVLPIRLPDQLSLAGPLEVGVFTLTEPWAEATASWSERPEVDGDAPLSFTAEPDAPAVRVDVTALARAWSSGERPNHGVELRALDVTVPREEVDLPRHFDLHPTFEGAREAAGDGREVLALVGTHFDEAALLCEHTELLLAAGLAYPSIRRHVSDGYALWATHAPAYTFIGVDRDGAATLRGGEVPTRGIRPPALLVLDGEGRVTRQLDDLDVVSIPAIAEFLGVPSEALEGPANEFWATPYALAVTTEEAGDLDAARALFEVIAECDDAAWALQAELRLTRPVLLRDFQRLGAAAAPETRDALVANALRFLSRTQRDDGSWPMGEPAFADHELGITILCAHAMLLHGQGDEAERGASWARAAVAETPVERLNSFAAAYWLDLEVARAARDLEADVEGAVTALIGGQLPGGAWSYDRRFGTSWRGGIGGWPVTERGRAHSMNTTIALQSLLAAKAAGFDVPDEALERGADALVAMRQAPGQYTYTFPEPINFTGTSSSIGRAPAGEAALAALGRAETADVVLALDTFVEHAADLHGPTVLPAGWLPPHAFSGYFRSFAMTHAARATEALPRSSREGVRTAIATAVLEGVGRDGLWCDTIPLGKPYATAMSLLALDACGAR